MKNARRLTITSVSQIPGPETLHAEGGVIYNENLRNNSEGSHSLYNTLSPLDTRLRLFKQKHNLREHWFQTYNSALYRPRTFGTVSFLASSAPSYRPWARILICSAACKHMAEAYVTIAVILLYP